MRPKSAPGKCAPLLKCAQREHKVTIPRETQETTGQKLKALLGLATRGLKNQQGRVNDLEAASCEWVEAELIVTPSPDGDQEDCTKASTGFTAPEAAFFQEPKDVKREMASSIKAYSRATDLNDFVRGLLDASKLEVENTINIAEWEENGTKELSIRAQGYDFQ